MRKFSFASIVIVLLILLSSLTHTESWVNRAFASRSEEMQFVHEQITDISWVVLLCVFSLLLRFRHRRTVRIYLLAVGFLMLTLAALHSHPLWTSGRKRSNEPRETAAQITRIHTVAADVRELGLKLNDVVTSMAFDRNGILWLSTPSNGPYCYQVQSNEVENLLRPDAVYGLSASDTGMWVLTSQGAFLYNGSVPVRSVTFPESVIPLCAVTAGHRSFFGTTRGLFVQPTPDSQPIATSVSDRITSLYAISTDVILVAGDSAFWRWTSFGVAPWAQFRHRTPSGFAKAGGRLFVATGEDGVLSLQPHPVQEIRFGIAELNIISPGAAAVYKDMPCFGTYKGAIVCKTQDRWIQLQVGEYPVTALAASSDGLFAWTGGRLLHLLP